MPRFTFTAPCAALALCMPASAALADVSAAEVWSDWKAMMTSGGYTLSAVEAASSNGVSVSDMSLTMDLSDANGQGALTVVFPAIRFVENADGSVTIELPTDTTIDVAMAPNSGEAVSFAIDAKVTDPVMTASGDPDDLTYNYTTAATDLVMRDLSVDGVGLGPDIASASVTLQDTFYVLTSKTEDLKTLTQTAKIGAVTYSFDFADPASSDSMDLNGTIRDVAFDGGVDLPPNMDPTDVNALLNAGFNFGGTFTTQGGSYDVTFNSRTDGSGTINATSEGAEITTALSPAGLSYALSQRGVNANMLFTAFPIPVSFATAEVATNVQMPVQKSNDAQGFAMGVAMQGLTVSDTLWGIFDPAGQLPRSPANLLLDLTGTGKVLFDYLDPAQAEVMAQAGTAPGTLDTLALNTLELEAGGARLTGAGAFTFDNDDLVTFGGFPRPQGAVDLMLTGGNTLLDTLVNMGFVPAEQAMGARMMMGLFAVPGDGPDTLTSRIEVNPEGHVLANGQRIR
ncbi:DUF2125 domain-containing protein [Tateyamaria sp.]|uniref:DUF2125 domain-containing protein n=1 Tax=Tateyamaria sp. TaxID=1929288 RepID=UPI003B227538